MTADIITIGDEILIGQVVDTNSSYIATQLNNIGVAVRQITSLPDQTQAIHQALDQAWKQVDIIIITGGLGPTRDDITKQALCEYLGDTLVYSPEVAAHIQQLFKKYHQQPPSTSLHTDQAMVPAQATLLPNPAGTAPGMWWQQQDKHIISLPGVPYEMKKLLLQEVIPALKKKLSRNFIVHKTLLTVGMGESVLADKIVDWENQLPPSIRLAYLPQLGGVRLRLSSQGTDESALHAEINRYIQQLKPLLGSVLIGEDQADSLEEVLAQLLVQKKQTLSLAESCTGGLISRMLTKNPGASRFYNGGYVTYATPSKVKILGIDPQLIEQHSVVSSPVAIAMAQRARELYDSDYAVATTGNAGPLPGDSPAEVGTVFIGIASPSGAYAEKFNFGNERSSVIHRASSKALELLRKEILKN